MYSSKIFLHLKWKFITSTQTSKSPLTLPNLSFRLRHNPNLFKDEISPSLTPQRFLEHTQLEEPMKWTMIPTERKSYSRDLSRKRYDSIGVKTLEKSLCSSGHFLLPLPSFSSRVVWKTLAASQSFDLNLCIHTSIFLVIIWGYLLAKSS